MSRLLPLWDLEPANDSAAGGTIVTIRASSFQSGTTATIGGKPATVSFKDMNTLTVATALWLLVRNASPSQIPMAKPSRGTPLSLPISSENPRGQLMIFLTNPASPSSQEMYNSLAP